ncbi:MAG: hypothetical protein ABL879_10080 [Devosia sp.]
MNDTDSSNDPRFHRLFDRLSRKFPPAGRFLEWIRRPSARLVRIPLALLLMLGGVFSFLPVLGIWMLPLGLLILAIDIVPLRRPVANTVVRGWRSMSNLGRWWRDRKSR